MHDFSMNFYDFLMTCSSFFSWLSYDFLMTFSWLSHDNLYISENAMVCAVSPLVHIWKRFCLVLSNKQSYIEPNMCHAMKVSIVVHWSISIFQISLPHILSLSKSTNISTSQYPKFIFLNLSIWNHPNLHLFYNPIFQFTNLPRYYWHCWTLHQWSMLSDRESTFTFVIHKDQQLC